MAERHRYLESLPEPPPPTPSSSSTNHPQGEEIRKDYKAIAKLCGTTDKGTTMEGMRKGLKALGLEYYGFQVGRADLPTIATPGILLSRDHYVVVERVKGLVLTTWDPTTNKEMPVDTSKIPPDKFELTMLLRTPPGDGLSTEH
ncbi:MAG: cysteine peptidase family C39 domain-containing protein [Fimbriimonadales bacterium]